MGAGGGGHHSGTKQGTREPQSRSFRPEVTGHEAVCWEGSGRLLRPGPVWASLHFILAAYLPELSGSWRIRDDVSHPRPSCGVQGEPKPCAEGDGLGVFAGREQGGRRDGRAAV